jgi:hypothetical protein
LVEAFAKRREKSHRELLSFWHSKNVTEFTLGIPVRTLDSGFLFRFVHVLWTPRVQDERGGILRPPLKKAGRDSFPAWRFATRFRDRAAADGGLRMTTKPQAGGKCRAEARQEKKPHP